MKAELKKRLRMHRRFCRCWTGSFRSYNGRVAEVEKVKDVVRKKAACARVLAAGQSRGGILSRALQLFIPAGY